MGSRGARARAPRGQAAQRTAKKLLNDTEDAPLSIAIELEGHSYSQLRSSDDFREGAKAFHEKRKAEFKGS
jgi:2-oxoglutaroyl-CoA hydrolase